MIKSIAFILALVSILFAGVAYSQSSGSLSATVEGISQSSSSENLVTPRSSSRTPPSVLLGKPVDATAGLVKVSIGLIIVVLAIFASAWLYKRYGNAYKGGNDSLKVVGGLSLGSRERVVLLNVGEEQLLIGVTPSSINTLLVLDSPLDAAATTDYTKNATRKDSQLVGRLAAAIRQRAK